MKTQTAAAQVLPELKLISLYTDPVKPWRFALLAPVPVTLSNGNFIIIPADYKTDFASVPRLLRGIVATVGNHNLGTLIHDYLYDKQYSITAGKDWKKDRLFCDLEMYYWLKKTGCSTLKASIMYYAVRLGGRSWYLN